MKESDSPFTQRPGRKGVVVAISDKRWYLRQWHVHKTLEINLVLRGSGHVLLDNRRYPLLPGHLVWLWPGQWHIPSEWSSDMMMWIIEWKPECLALLKRARRADNPAPGDGDAVFCRRLAAPVLQRLDGTISSVAALERPDAFNAGLVFALFALWDEFIAAEPVAECPAFHPRLGRALALLNDSPDDLTQEELARRVQLSPYYFSSLFQKQTGMTLPAYRNRLRLQRFFQLYTAHPEINLLQLALDAGFGSYAQFYRIFEKAVGQPPREWLRQK